MDELTWEDIGVIVDALTARKRILQFHITATHSTSEEREVAREELARVNSLLARTVRFNHE
jgi:hypothetical protein